MRQRAVRDQQRLDSGAVTSPKDLESLQREIASLAKRQGDLEDVVLEVMERRESAQERVTELTARASRRPGQGRRRDRPPRRRVRRSSTTRPRPSTKEREIARRIVPADLLKLYEKLRAQQGGVGAARLYQRRCEGCQLELNITELNDVRAAPPRHGAALRELPPHPGPYGRVGPVAWRAAYGHVRRRGDGGSRGNPGPAGYGAVVIDAATGETLAEAAEYIGVATNNVAEYRGLIAGPARRAGPRPGGRRSRVRMDSKLVVEQMSGRWKIKHPDMKPLAAEAARTSSRADRSPTSGSRASRTSTRTGWPTRRWTRAQRGEQWEPSASTAELDARRGPDSGQPVARRRCREGAARRGTAGSRRPPSAGAARPTWARPPPSSCCGTARRPSRPRSGSRAAAAATRNCRPRAASQADRGRRRRSPRAAPSRTIVSSPLQRCRRDGGGRRRPARPRASRSRTGCARRTSAPGRG